MTVDHLAGAPQAMRLEVASRRTPRRVLGVPPLGAAESVRVLWHRPHSSVARPRVEPDDPFGRHLMRYLLAGQHAAAAAAARTVERLRGAASTVNWSAPSYTQLLVGYAYALGGDRARLALWCRRTAAARTLGADGLALAAESAWRHHDDEATVRLLTEASRFAPPTLRFGMEIGLRLTTLIDGDRLGKELDLAPLEAVRRRYIALLVKTDASSATLSVPQTNVTSPDLSRASGPRRATAAARFAATVWRYRTIIRTSGVPNVRNGFLSRRATVMSVRKASADSAGKGESTKVLGGAALWVAVFALAIWLLFSIYLLTMAGSSTDLTWTRLAWVFGSVEAVAFTAAGALFGTAVQRDRADKAESRADSAEDKAELHRDDATKGRALAASLQADTIAQGALKSLAPGQSSQDDVRRRHADLARSLFGDLVPPS
ncbi:hypothetical protein AB5J62_15060 [Amycolatopsis sp. cg5]|uniref:hypothetical protein n=1 Tax=Amycolatopsis sp. cg5 TaxID=3238802 RepID=UPI00352687DE